MDSINKECNPLKHEYDNCFNKWYSEQFLNGNWETENGEPCKELFTKYRQCVTVSSAFCQGTKRFEKYQWGSSYLLRIWSLGLNLIYKMVFVRSFLCSFFQLIVFIVKKYFATLKRTQWGRSLRFREFKFYFFTSSVIRTIDVSACNFHNRKIWVVCFNRVSGNVLLVHILCKNLKRQMQFNFSAPPDYFRVESFPSNYMLVRIKSTWGKIMCICNYICNILNICNILCKLCKT